MPDRQVVGPRIPPARRLHGPVVACLLLLLVYSGLAALKSPFGPLAPDSGGKLATLEVARSPVDVDVGYWAESLDPDGSSHPLQYTREFQRGWIQLSTLPMSIVAQPIAEHLGLRAVAVIPMLGGVACALAAAALARRFGGSSNAAFWAIGLATPVAVYAVDFWEHVPGLALMLWGVVLACDLLEGRGGAARALAAGALFGAAASLRTEAYIYLLVLVGVILVVRRAATARERTMQAGALTVGALLLVALNVALEQMVLGSDQRSSRTLSLATAAGRSLWIRIEDALTGLIGVSGDVRASEWVVGAALAVLMGLTTALLGSGDRDRRRIGVVMAVVVGLVLAARFAADLGFVPGMLIASPLAVAGFVTAWRDARLRWLVAVALLPLPLVWWFQSGGVGPQWGSRYQLLSGVLLATLFFCTVQPRPLATGVVLALAVLVTGAGWGVAVERAAQIDRGMRVLLARGDDAVVSFQANLLREGGAFYTRDRHWLNGDRRDPPAVMEILERAGDRRVAVLARDDDELPSRLGAYEWTGAEPLVIRPGEHLVVSEYRLSPSS